MKTKDRILITALALFNENGTAKITTNHIAEAMRISPGNLYYHYRNKEEIILRLWETMVSKITVPFTNEATPQIGTAFVKFLYDFFDTIYDYRFFWLELTALLDKDPTLKALYTTRARTLLSLYKDSVRLWKKNGLLRSDLSDADLDQMVENTWFLSQFWAINTYIHEDRLTRENLRNGANHILAAMKPCVSSDVVTLIEPLVLE